MVIGDDVGLFGAENDCTVMLATLMGTCPEGNKAPDAKEAPKFTVTCVVCWLGACSLLHEENKVISRTIKKRISYTSKKP